MASDPGRDQRMNTHSNPFDSVSTGTQRRNMRHNGIMRQRHIREVFPSIALLAAELDEGDRSRIQRTSRAGKRLLDSVCCLLTDGASLVGLALRFVGRLMQFCNKIVPKFIHHVQSCLEHLLLDLHCGL